MKTNTTEKDSLCGATGRGPYVYATVEKIRMLPQAGKTESRRAKLSISDVASQSTMLREETRLGVLHEGSGTQKEEDEASGSLHSLTWSNTLEHLGTCESSSEQI